MLIKDLLVPVSKLEPAEERVFIAEFEPFFIEVEGESEQEIKQQVKSIYRKYLLENGLPKAKLHLARKGALTRKEIYIGQLVETSDFRTGIVVKISSYHKLPVHVLFSNGEIKRYQCHDLVAVNKNINRMTFKYKKLSDGLNVGDLCFVTLDNLGLAVFGRITESGNRCIHLVKNKRTLYIKEGIENLFLL